MQLPSVSNLKRRVCAIPGMPSKYAFHTLVDQYRSIMPLSASSSISLPGRPSTSTVSSRTLRNIALKSANAISLSSALAEHALCYPYAEDKTCALLMGKCLNHGISFRRTVFSFTLDNLNREHCQRSGRSAGLPSPVGQIRRRAYDPHR